MLWSFRYYVDASKRSDVREAYDRGSRQLKAKFLSRLKMLASLPRNEWNENLHKHLAGPYAGLCEIRFKADNVQQRPLGFHSRQSEFVILFWAIEKGGKFIPKSSCEIAFGRMAEVINDRERADALWLALE